MPRGSRMQVMEATVEAVPASLREGGKCRSADPEWFFSDDADETALALAICRQCPVMDHCLAYAIDNEDHGVWGGTTASQRRKLRVKTYVSPETRRQNAELMAALLSGHRTLDELAREFGCSVRTLQRRRSELELSSRTVA